MLLCCSAVSYMLDSICTVIDGQYMQLCYLVSHACMQYCVEGAVPLFSVCSMHDTTYTIVCSSTVQEMLLCCHVVPLLTFELL